MSAIIAIVGKAAQTLRAIIGVPDYDRYVEHCRLHHPDTSPMTRDQFARDLLERKYSRSGSRCC
jgi:uncharacterized short protein YbdD (DUF466 family)